MRDRSPVGFLVLLSLVACRPSDRPVTTTTDDGSSTSASSQAAAQRNRALVRVVNAMPAGPRLAILADERTIFDGVASQEVTRYRELDEDIVTFAVRPSAEPAANARAGNREILSDGQRYTAVVMPNDEGNAPQLRILKDDVVPDSGKARLRIIHAAAGAGTVDVALSEQPEKLFSGVQFGGQGDFKDVDPGSGRLEVRRGGEKLVLASLKAVELNAGSAYTVVITGGPKGPLHLVTFEDRPGPPDMALND